MKQNKNLQQNQRRKKRQSDPSSALSIMGIVLLLSQNSSCALTIQPRANVHRSCSTVPILKRRDNERFPPLPSPSAVSSSSILRFDSSTALYYQNYKASDDDGKTTTTTTSTTDTSKQSQSSPSSISHKHQNDHHISNFFHTLWTSGKTRRAKELHATQLQEQQDKQQYVLDEYLELIDRRYKRLHEDEQSSSLSSSKATHENGGFTNALQWLKHSSDSSTLSEIEKQRQKDDAIYVLGLAGLASKKLLQKHHLPIPESKKKSFIDVAFQNESLELIKDGMLVDRQQQEQHADNELVSSLTSPTNFAASIAAYTSATISTMGKAMVIIKVLQQIKVAHYLKIIVSRKVTQSLLSSIRIGGKAFANVLGSFVSFITNTSGSKHSLQLVSVFAAAIFAFAVSVVRPMISKA